MIAPEQVLEFWLDQQGPKRWYIADPDLDAEIKDTFEAAWEQARDGAYSMWLTYPSGALAYILLTDQFPRNMFRGMAKSFSTDRAAVAAAKSAISKGWDMRIDEPARQFFYLPLMHSENLCDQDRCVRLMCDRIKDSASTNLLHAQAHREVIRDFGRFPHRNEALGRQTKSREQNFLDTGGYGAVLRSLNTKTAA